MNIEKIKKILIANIEVGAESDEQISHYVNKAGQKLSVGELKKLIESEDPDLFNWFEDQLLDRVLEETLAGH